MGHLKIVFESGKFKEDAMEMFDETHFVISVDYGRTLRFCGDSEVKYANVSSGDHEMTMFVSLNVDLIEIPFMIFVNKDRN